MKVILAAIAALLLAACSTTPFDITKSQISIDTHAGNLAAAKYATDNGYPERAAFWMAVDQVLTANEQQANACVAAIQASLPQVPTAPSSMSPELAIEMGAEAVGNFSGIPARVNVLCAPLPIPTLPVMPKLP